MGTVTNRIWYKTQKRFVLHTTAVLYGIGSGGVFKKTETRMTVKIDRTCQQFSFHAISVFVGSGDDVDMGWKLEWLWTVDVAGNRNGFSLTQMMP